MGRWIGWLAVAFAVLVALAFGFRERPQAVATARVERGALEVSLEEEGRTRVIDRYVVSAPIAGYARRIDLEVGDRVAAGADLLVLEPLASRTLDPRSRAEATARVAAAEAALRSAAETAEAAEADFQLRQTEEARIRRLFETETASREQLDRAEAGLRGSRGHRQSARFQVDVARHQRDAARTALAYAGRGGSGEELTISSPVAGRVLRRMRVSEGVVAAGVPLLEIGDPGALEVEVDVLSADAVRIPEGGDVFFERWGGGAPLPGVVRTVEPVGFTKVSALGVEEQRVWVICDFAGDRAEWQRLGDGYRVQARFVLWRGDDVLRVPSSALFRRDGGWATFVVERGVARLREVGVGHRGGLRTEIVSGLAEVDIVITHPDESIADGTRVKTD